MKKNTNRCLWLKIFRDVLIFPFNVIFIVPFLIYEQAEALIPDNLFIKVCGGLLMAAGVTLFGYTVFLFSSIGKGTLAPWSDKKMLVISGPYRYARNPMISSVLVILVGEAFLFHSTSILIWSFVFFLINTFYFVIVEEPALTKKFGAHYREYKKRVPRWIPRFKPYVKSLPSCESMEERYNPRR